MSTHRELVAASVPPEGALRSYDASAVLSNRARPPRPCHGMGWSGAGIRLGHPGGM
ncbi:MAG: hypothetical protein GY814_20465 [Gammaproteobacteria bacterium]|nr:hypothetical protein [Gammaproteobacteria bacterium]